MDKEGKINTLGERAFLSTISDLVDTTLLEFNEDASVFELPDSQLLVINADMLVNDTDVLPNMSYNDVGKKAVVMAVSDIVSKGAKPAFALSSIGFPKHLEITYGQSIIQGFRDKCHQYNMLFLGGDLNESCDIIIDSIAVGFCQKQQLLSRRGVCDGDVLYTSPKYGLTTLGFKILLEQISTVPEAVKNLALTAVYQPEARLDLLSYLHQLPINGSMDCSDGLYRSLKDLMEINQLGFKLTNLPLAPEIKMADIKDLNPLSLALNGGEEFELLIVVPEKQKTFCDKLINRYKLDLINIGMFSKDVESIIIEDPNYSSYDFEATGFNHFS